MKLRNFTLLVVTMFTSMQVLTAATFKGIVVDQSTGAPLLGATVMVKGTMVGTATGLDGSFEIKVDKKSDPIVISYISYVTQEFVAPEGESIKDLTISLVPDTQLLASVQVVTRANTETEMSLQTQRMTSNVAIENIGVREMSLKGLSNAEDGVKKMTGVSIADAGQVIVRGLGDRYSITTLNRQQN
ncbi:MAG: carboxypeptidase-like regulatory domain-containing protein [Rikenellaceae bacterium]